MKVISRQQLFELVESHFGDVEMAHEILRNIPQSQAVDCLSLAKAPTLRFDSLSKPNGKQSGFDPDPLLYK